MTPTLGASASEIVKAAFSRTICPQATANLVKMAMRRDCLWGMYAFSSKFLTSQAKVVSKPVVSNLVMGAAPETPATRFVQLSPRSFPMGVTAARRVTTTRFPIIKAPFSSRAGPDDRTRRTDLEKRDVVYRLENRNAPGKADGASREMPGRRAETPRD